jgi:hypothetical protein
MSVVRGAVAANSSIPTKELIAQAKTSNAVNVFSRMAHRARDALVDESDGAYADGFSKLESLLALFCSKNDGSTSDVQFTGTGDFVRAFLSHPFVAQHAKYGQQVLGADGTFMKHGFYKRTMLVLVGRDGDNKNITLAVGLCASEDGENCGWFMEK